MTSPSMTSPRSIRRQDLSFASQNINVLLARLSIESLLILSGLEDLIGSLSSSPLIALTRQGRDAFNSSMQALIAMKEIEKAFRGAAGNGEGP